MIPDMTHPLSSHWRQPNKDKILVDNEVAIMEKETLKKLMEYSMSIPSGAYEGKMWKRKYVNARTNCEEWILYWYGPSEKEGMVSINERSIILL
jgi:hypothetical protein